MSQHRTSGFVNYNLEGRVAIVTGASKGIGFSIAQGLIHSGVRLLMISRDEKNLKRAIKTIANEDRVISLAGDVKDPNLSEQALELCEVKWGKVDILINNSGGPPMGTLLDHDIDVWDETLQGNLMSVVRFCKAVLPGMKQRRWGRIVNISSTIAKEPTPPMILSATARAGVAAFTKALANDVAADNITVNTLCPGGVRTDRMVNLFKKAAERDGKTLDEVIANAQESIPIGRFAEPEELAHAAMYLCSEQGAYVTGVNLSVDGGLSRTYT